jgi:MFS family permease
MDNATAMDCISMHFLGIAIGGPFFAYLSRMLNDHKKALFVGSVSMLVVFTIVAFIKMPIILLSVMLFLFGASASSQTLSFVLALSISSKQIGPLVTGFINSITMLGCSIMVRVVGWGIDFSKNLHGATEYSQSDYRNGVALLLISSVIALVALCILIYNSRTKEYDVA